MSVTDSHLYHILSPTVGSKRDCNIMSIDVRFPSSIAKKAIGNIVNLIRKQDLTHRLNITRNTSIQSHEEKQTKVFFHYVENSKS